MFRRLSYISLFLIIATILSAQPSNDDICNAIALTVDANSCASGGNVSSTVAGGDSVGTCWVGGTANSTVWHTFVAPSSGNVTVTTNHVGTGFDTQVAVFSSSNGTCSGALTEVGCNDDISGTNTSSEVVFTNLTSGTTYFVEVNGYDVNTGSYCINVHDGGEIFVNDDCADAMNLWVSSSCNPMQQCSHTNYPITVSGTAEAGEVAGSCWTQGLTLNSVWYKFTAVDISTTIEVTAVAGEVDPHITIYSGSCGSLTEVACQEDCGCAPVAEGVDLTFSTIVDSVYYVQYDHDSTIGCNDICLHSASGIDIPPANNICASATTLDLDSTELGNNWLATAPNNTTITNCGDDNMISIENDIWFAFTPSDTGDYDFIITGEGGCSAPNNLGSVHTGFWPKGLQMAIFDACPSGSSYNPRECETIHSENDIVLSDSLDGGATYYVMVDGNSGMSCSFSLSTNLATTLPIKLASFIGKNVGNENILEWTTSAIMPIGAFIIERSVDGPDFYPIGKVKVDNILANDYYIFVDEDPVEGINYYRLKKRDDQDHQSYVSKVVGIKYSSNEPSIAVAGHSNRSNILRVFLNNFDAEKLQLHIMDVLGRTLHNESFIVEDQSLTRSVYLASSLTPGLYFVVVETNEYTLTQNFAIK